MEVGADNNVGWRETLAGRQPMVNASSQQRFTINLGSALEKYKTIFISRAKRLVYI